MEQAMGEFFTDFFKPADEANRTELDAEIRESEAERKEREAEDEADAKSIYKLYKRFSGDVKLSDTQIELLIKFGYAYRTEEPETEFGGEVVIK